MQPHTENYACENQKLPQLLCIDSPRKSNTNRDTNEFATTEYKTKQKPKFTVTASFFRINYSGKLYNSHIWCLQGCHFSKKFNSFLFISTIQPEGTWVKLKTKICQFRSFNLYIIWWLTQQRVSTQYSSWYIFWFGLLHF